MGLAAFNRLRREKAAQAAVPVPVDKAPEPAQATKPAKKKKG